MISSPRATRSPMPKKVNFTLARPGFNCLSRAEAFLLFSQNIPTANLGFVDSRATEVEVAIRDVEYIIHQSPTLLSSARAGGTTGAGTSILSSPPPRLPALALQGSYLRGKISMSSVRAEPRLRIGPGRLIWPCMTYARPMLCQCMGCS